MSLQEQRQKFHESMRAYPEPMGDGGLDVTEKTFPIQGEVPEWFHSASGEIVARRPRRPAGKIPWRLAVCAYNEYSRLYGTQQSLERLAERGGFGWTEFGELFAAWAVRQALSGSGE